MNRNIWMVRAGRNAMYVDEFLSNNLISIGWNEVGDLAKVDTLEQVKEVLTTIYPNRKKGWVNICSGQIYRFKKEIVKGELVMTYNSSERIYHIGEVVSEYIYDSNSNDSEDHHHIRRVKWKNKVERDDLSASTKNSLGAISTIFKISLESSKELITKIENKRGNTKADVDKDTEEEELDVIKEDIEDKAKEFLKDKIANINWEEMQELMAGILRAMGYKTMISPKGPDRGKDIIASPDGLGLEDPKIIVEVKHRKKTTMGSQEVRSLLGGLRQNDKGIFLSTGGFTKEAKYEAERANNSLTLINLDLLVQLIFQYYDDFDSETKTLIPLKKIYWPI